MFKTFLGLSEMASVAVHEKPGPPMRGNTQADHSFRPRESVSPDTHTPATWVHVKLHHSEVEIGKKVKK